MIAGGGVGAERPLEPFLGVEPLRFVIQDDHEAFGLLIPVGQDQGADLVHPVPPVGAAGDVDQFPVDHLAFQQAVHRVVVGAERLAAAAGQRELAGVAGDRAAQIRQRGGAMQGQRRVVRPANRAGGLDNDHALRQPGDDLLQVA